ncbi:MAG TPA: 6-bladed beta-propeller [Nitrososphaeraceae archaeon]|nr:6-bladed beta-propeller [Nitrososphaeraceae archaeon]
MVFLNLTRTLIFSTLLVFFILPERNSIMDNVVLGGNVESISLNYCFDFKWGSEGSANGQFLRPHDVNFDSKGNVYVSDRDRNDIQKFTPNGTFLMKWGSEGNNPGQFNVPYSIEVDPFDNIYVVDRGNDRIQKFNENGKFVKQWDRPENINETDQEFASPEDMVINQKTGVIYITDTGNERVVKLDRNFSYISQWGSVDGKASSERGKFNHPHGIDVDSKGNVYVNELENPRIQKFDENGKFVKQWGSEGKGNGEFTPLLEHLEVDSKQDRIFMVDGALNPRIQVFDTNGNFTTTFGTSGSGNGQFSKPEHVNTDSSGNVYVVDRGNQRMQVFSKC